MASVIPPELDYDIEPESLNSRAYRTKYESTGASFNGGDRMEIRIPRLRNGFLDTENPHLDFTVNLGATVDATEANLRLGNLGAHAFIRKIEILQGNQTVVVQDNYQEIVSMLRACNTGMTASSPNSLTSGVVYNETNKLLGLDIITTYGASTNDMSFSIPLIGLLSGSRMFPLTWLNSDLVLAITWESDAKKVVYSSGATVITAGTLTYKKCNYNAKNIILTDASQQLVNRMAGWNGKNIVSWSDTQWRAVTRNINTITSNNSTVTTLVPGNRYRSVNNILVAGFQSAPTGSTGDPFAQYIFFNSAQYRIAGIQYPLQALESLSEMAQSTQACFSNASPTLSNSLMDSTHTQLSKIPSNAAQTPTFAPRGVVGLNFEAFSNGDGTGGGY